MTRTMLSPDEAFAVKRETAPMLTGQRWHDRVAEVAALAKAKLPQCDNRINRAMALVLADASRGSGLAGTAGRRRR